ncbi:lysophospholipid acyltransferase family protein, partial [Williamsia sp.]|uniref:lysophospholipid acyltransferase family protein n=1 Tax=Williamsia sp. TaxID=1872085 RepID=UPI002F9391C2
MEPVFRALEVTAMVLVKAQGLKLDFVGLDKLPASGGVVLAINHTGYLDFLPAALGVYHRRRRVRFMIKSEMQKIAVMRFLIKHTKTVPVDRMAGAQAYEL